VLVSLPDISSILYAPVITLESIAASRVLVQESIASRFIEGIKREFETAEKGLGDDPLELGTSLGPVVDKLQFDRIMRYIEMGKSTANLIFGGTRKTSKGCYITPTLFLNPTDDSPIWREEIFGPVLAVRTFKDVTEAIKLANDTSYGLACKLRCYRLLSTS
jgi:aldehyde dehydrogenase (NAD+)